MLIQMSCCIAAPGQKARRAGLPALTFSACSSPGWVVPSKVKLQKCSRTAVRLMKSSHVAAVPEPFVQPVLPRALRRLQSPKEGPSKPQAAKQRDQNACEPGNTIWTGEENHMLKTVADKPAAADPGPAPSHHCPQCCSFVTEASGSRGGRGCAVGPFISCRAATRGICHLLPAQGLQR